MKYVKHLAASVLLAATVAGSAVAGTLVINSNASDAAPKQAWDEVVSRFKAANPDVEVKYNLYDHESYKTTIRNWLATSPPDVVFWFAGNRMKTFVDRGLLEDVSDLWEANGMNQDFAAAAPAMSVNGKKYGVPYTYYQWGVYYRKDIFDKFGITEPKNWDEFKAAAAKLKANNVAPFAIGTKYLWTAAGWFDYLNLRTNGLDFHIQLMDGKVPYTDDRVKKTFAKWKELVEPGYFLDNHASYSWQEAQPFLYNGQAAMYLIGNFITPNFPPEMDGKMGFFQFPVIDPSVGLAEDAPMDTIHIPSKAKNKEEARKFLAFVATPEIQKLINDSILQIPTNNKASVKDDPFLNVGVEMLGKAVGTAQFYDRDTDPAMAKEGMKGFQEFMVHPDRLDKILQRLEKARQRTFK
ncbi:putative ABC-type sugar transport system,periplasmic component [Vibrio nigripulchritudo SO65]|uniref:ABC transporter substrate-binding protein n=1 Tax=Vibrio nigripulchritudo TaxID=28173 RepID=UPI0003B23B23|nr:extracellular solute-binding protein [Vibrio nigripulchritudo]CCN34149.1 putative ABC-type sugar transport system,periplasmic component [Vibrio nigripulchritudo AM115]CCN44137.1 putative ABC-type sugar transport system,periplasmic component [Vibrio nigripulchritudo FTn2]CCN67035.1 putative ABC-type sugar transport system,periplasmic component [Vibrio nigripulchritudo POn4]CCN74179.1 putative ABC-type sugar transport system,periplasmic component [Vibrio nigripulchritudo SO65]